MVITRYSGPRESHKVENSYKKGGSTIPISLHYNHHPFYSLIHTTSTMSISSRTILFFAVVLIACTYMVSAAPIKIVDNGVQLEANINSPSNRINMFKKVDEDEDEDEDEYVTSTSTSTSTATSSFTSTSTEDATATTTEETSTTTINEEATTTTTEEATTTSNKKKSTTTTTEPEEPTEAPVSKSKSSSSGSFSGDATWYNTGMGSCGWDNKESQMVVAVNHGQMENGANPNKNPNCGRSITVKGPKGSVTVKVVDTCPGCDYGALDLSPAAFAEIADLSQGRITASWSWN